MAARTALRVLVRRIGTTHHSRALSPVSAVDALSSRYGCMQLLSEGMPT